jgi:hypothetical protein
MQKGYICAWEPGAPPNDNRKIYAFCPEAKDAFYWPTHYLAEIECLDLNEGVTIPSGGTYICTNLQIEEEGPEKFLIYCEAPFEPKPPLK